MFLANVAPMKTHPLPYKKPTPNRLRHLKSLFTRIKIIKRPTLWRNPHIMVKNHQSLSRPVMPIMEVWWSQAAKTHGSSCVSPHQPPSWSRKWASLQIGASWGECRLLRWDCSQPSLLELPIERTSGTHSLTLKFLTIDHSITIKNYFGDKTTMTAVPPSGSQTELW